MNFFRSMEIDPTCKFSPPQSRSGGISFYGFSAPRRFHATKTHSKRAIMERRSCFAKLIVARISSLMTEQALAEDGREDNRRDFLS
jgi:hypothetical protein